MMESGRPSLHLIPNQRQLRSAKRTRHESDSGNGVRDNLVSPTKVMCHRKSGPSFTVKSQEREAFFRLTDDPVIFQFLQMDFCKKTSDKYLLAMVFAYFKRAEFTVREYNRRNFFVALYLACDIEEDEDYKHEIFPWALGYGWSKHYMAFLKKRDKLWARMDYRAVVSKKCCDEIMMIDECHWIWKRERPSHHSGAIRVYHRDEDEDSEDDFPRGPDASPLRCLQCEVLQEYDSASPDKACWYLSSSNESSPDLTSRSLCKSTRVVAGSWLNMEALRTTLTAAED